MNRIGYGAIPPAAQMRVMMNAARKRMASQSTPQRRELGAAVIFYAATLAAAAALGVAAFGASAGYWLGVFMGAS